MYTLVESDKFKKAVADIWTEEERLEFFSFIAVNPLAGDVIPGLGGLRKIRWKVSGKGKRGGARVLYYNVLEEGIINMYYIYVKAEIENMTPKEILKLGKE